MKQEKVILDNLLLIGMTARTNNKNELNPDTSKIGALAGAYWGNQVANAFKERTNPGITYSVYTDYESNEHGEYTYFIGEQVEALDDQDPSKFSPLIIPASTYQKFTTVPGKMPDVVITAWKNIWQMTPKVLGGKRNYLADFEIYDQRASDPNHAVVDIYIGVGA